ncbi:MAG: monofunctional biosynthetic peptidoglycan transglycosylase [Bacillales bacterium]|nr:monofunctional biosynthetic peptidoglycan transglycosylase [Bacillales bacterium]
MIGLRVKKRSIPLKFFTLLCILSIISVFSISSVGIFAKLAGAPNLTVNQTTLYYDDSGQVIGEVSHGQKRFWVRLDQISPLFIDAILSIEDRSFFEHNGLDFKRIGGALIADLKAGEKVQGASTISQQYARNLFLGKEKTLERKLKEAFYALRIEANYSKDEILEGYLNTIYFGHGMYGVEAASQFYFNKNAKDLDLAEAALLAGVPKGPSVYSPLLSLENAKSRQTVILSSLLNTKKITKTEHDRALSEKLTFFGNNNSIYHTIAPYFLDEAKKEVQKILKDKELSIKNGGLRIYTSLNIEAQKNVEVAIKNVLPAESSLQTAVISMNPKNGEVKALVGGRDYSKSPFNRATQSLRQPGSTFKPILYYAALEKGFTPSTSMRSEATTFTYDNGRREYSPHNYNNIYADKSITLAQALALSDNIFAVKTCLFLGTDELPSIAQKFGITSKTESVPSAALGTSAVRPIEMTNAFNYFANSGKKVSPSFITVITDCKGNVLYERKKQSSQILKKDATFVMAQLLKGIFDKRLNGYTSVTGASIADRLSHDYAAKSGTTSTDSWMIGFTPTLTTGVWVGYDSNQKLELWNEQKYARNIWAAVMENNLASVPVSKMDVPKNVVAVDMDPETGLLASETCPNKIKTYYVKGTEPKETCYLHGGSSKNSTKEQTKKIKKQKKWLNPILKIFH